MASNESTQPAKSPDPGPNSGVTRRSFLKHVGAAAVVSEGLLAARPAAAQEAPATPAASSEDGVLRGPQQIKLTINGKDRAVSVEPRTTLLSALRDRLEPAVTGPKLVCDAGTCGACTVLVDGKTAYGCSLLAIDMVGRKITTVEGLGTPDNLSPVQAAFCEKDAMMCGFCTSGFVTSVTGLLMKNPNPTHEQIQEGCKGNFCRCGTFPHIFEAAKTAAEAMGKK
ncbi:MAG: (2Fe-2S)-binding protein [Tepidisphaeraceae bacterium]